MLGSWHTAACACQLANALTITLLLALDTDTGGWEHRWGSISGYRSFGLRIMWLLPAFCLLAAATHAYGAAGWWARGCRPEPEYQELETRGALPWLEYSLSAGLMTWLLAVMSGQRDVGVLCSLLLLNALLQSYGYLLDREDDSRRAGALLAQSALLFVAMWTIIFSAFYSSLDQAEHSVPPVVYAIVWQLFALYCLFGVLPLARWLGWVRSGALYQKGFIVLSTISKSTLVWMVWFGAVRDGARR